MDEYISREAVNNLIEDMRNNRLLLVCERTNLYILKSKVAELPTADVQPVNHGRWIHIRGCWWQCSNCENNLIYTMSDRGRTEKHRYCSKCGARMDGDTE